MLSNPTTPSKVFMALALSMIMGTANGQSTSLSSMLGKQPPRKSATTSSGEFKSTEVSSKDKDVPDWLRDSERVNRMLGENADARIENARVVRKIETPIPGLDGFVVAADSYTKNQTEGRQELFVFYTDKSRRYLVVGMMIDMEKERDLNMAVERFVRGEMSDNPAKALRPQDMHSITLKGGNSKSDPLTFIVDLGPDAGKSSLLGVVKLHQTMLASGANPRPLRIVLVSAGNDETSTGAMAMAMGFEQISGDGVARLVEFAEKGRSASWLDSKRLGKDARLKRAIGSGIFQIDDNSTQALLARINTLPLVYDGAAEKTKNIPLPVNQAEWRALLKK